MDAQTDENLNPQQRLEQILAHKQFSHIPVKIQFEFNGKQYDMPLFMYVLRHTFWRPREILLYYAKLLALAENLKRWGTPVTTDAIRKCIKATTSIVVESEFIDELKSTVTNIEKIIAVFYKHKSQFDYQTLRKALQKEIYSFATGDLSDGDVVAKVKFLYNIGFLGLKLTTEQQTNLGLWHDYAFYFNEGPAIFEDRYLSEDDLVNYTYVIHPIFSEYLRLDTKGFDLPLFFDWEYVRKSEAAMLARQ